MTEAAAPAGTITQVFSWLPPQARPARLFGAAAGLRPGTTRPLQTIMNCQPLTVPRPWRARGLPGAGRPCREGRHAASRTAHVSRRTSIWASTPYSVAWPGDASQQHVVRLALGLPGGNARRRGTEATADADLVAGRRLPARCRPWLGWVKTWPSGMYWPGCRRRLSCVLVPVRGSMSGCRCHRSSLRANLSRRRAADGGSLGLRYPAWGLEPART
jgi:hypothetical protein